MNIGYVKLDKLTKIQYIYRNVMKKIRVEGNNYYLPSNSEKILEMVRNKLKEDGIEFIVQEKDIECGYPELSGKCIVKYMLPEIIEYCFKVMNKQIRMEEIHICVENFNKENINIIEELCSKVKIVNIVTNHLRQFQELEKRLERNEIYVTVSSNRRKALKRASLIINLDFENLKDFNINRNAIIVNTQNNLELGKDFEGICIERIKVDTNRIMRVFSEMNMAKKEELIEAEIIKKEKYDEIRKLVNTNKLIITQVYGKRDVIGKAEFESVKRKISA